MIRKLIITLMALSLVACEKRTHSVEAAPLATTASPINESEETHVVAQAGVSLEDTVRVLAEEIGERNLGRFQALEKTRRYLSERLALSGYQVDQNSFTDKLLHKEAHNLIVEIPGGDEILLIGAHYDTASLTPGANDNGSGVALLLRLAERLREGSFEKTIRFVFFVNEEPPYFMTGDMGSAVYARQCAQNKDPIVGMISLETLAFYSDEAGSQHFPPGIEGYPDTGNFLAFVSDKKSQDFLDECFANFDGFPKESLVAPGRVEGVSWSDHASFWRFGYPAIMLTDTAPFRYPHYHRATDTPEQLDFQKFEKLAESVEAMVRNLAGEKP